MKAEKSNVDGTIEELLDGLISVIAEEATLFERFLELLEQQQKALANNETGELKAVTAKLRQIVTHSQMLEDKRCRLVEEIRLQAGAQDDLDVSHICEMADTGRSNQLRSIRNTILDLYSRIEETRMRNGLLIEQSLEQIQHTVEMIGRIPAQKEIYHRQGSISRDFTPVGIDRRV